jgi:glutamine synthetase
MAFTGNKFEFRMLGSSQSISGPNIALNTIMAEELEQFADRLETAGDFHQELAALVRETLTAHRRIIFNGNGYDESWLAEAAKRGLVNSPTTADALPAYVAEKNVELFVRHGIYTREEIQARYEIHIENYTSVLGIEANTMIDMIRHQILPAVSDYSAALCGRAVQKAALGVSNVYETRTATGVGRLCDNLLDACEKLESAVAATPEDAERAMQYSRDAIVPAMQRAREIADQLESITASACWPFPAYRDLLFYL